MAVKFVMSEPVAVAADRLMQQMILPEEHETLSKELGSTVATATRTDEGRLTKIELYVEEPERRGGGTSKATILMDFNRESGECHWIRKDHTHGDRVKTSGVMRIVSVGDAACEVQEEGEIDVAYPIVGKKIAKKIAAAMERNQAKKFRFWERRVAG